MKILSFTTVEEFFTWMESNKTTILAPEEVISYTIQETKEIKIISGNGKNNLSELPHWTPHYAKNYKGVNIDDI